MACVDLISVLIVEKTLSEQELRDSMKVKARRGTAAFQHQLANYIFWAKPKNKHIKKAFEFSIVSDDAAMNTVMLKFDRDALRA